MSVEPRQYVMQRFDGMIAYYWRQSSRNKQAYKWSRLVIIVLSSLVTLVASLTSSEFLKDQATVLALSTPVLAALLTTTTAFSQSFQWGASWREMVITAERLQMERDRIATTADAQLDPKADLRILNDLVLKESRGFFDRVMGSSMGSASTDAGGAGPSSEPERPALKAGADETPADAARRVA